MKIHTLLLLGLLISISASAQDRDISQEKRRRQNELRGKTIQSQAIEKANQPYINEPGWQVINKQMAIVKKKIDEQLDLMRPIDERIAAKEKAKQDVAGEKAALKSSFDKLKPLIQQQNELKVKELEVKQQIDLRRKIQKK